MEPAAPEQAKNICTKITPNAVPVSLRDEKNLGNAVAAITVNVEIKGRDDTPAGSSTFVIKVPAVTKLDATDKEMARVGRVIEDGLPSSTATSDIVNCCASSSSSSFGLSSVLVAPGMVVSVTTVAVAVTVVLVVSVVVSLSSSPAFAMENKNAKYSATTTLSAAIAAATASPPILSVSATATKLIAPPICLAAKAHATLHPTSPPNDFNGIIGNVIIVANTVANAPTPKAVSNVPVSLITLFKSESNNNNGIANGTKNLFTMVYIGDWNGMIPIFAKINAIAIVASGADKAFPIIVRRSNEVPNVDNHSINVKT